MNYTLAQWLEHLANKQPEDFEWIKWGDEETDGAYFAFNGEEALYEYDSQQLLSSDDCDDIAARIGKGYVIYIFSAGLMNMPYTVGGTYYSHDTGQLPRCDTFKKVELKDVPATKRQAAIDTLIEIIRHEHGEPEATHD